MKPIIVVLFLAAGLSLAGCSRVAVAPGNEGAAPPAAATPARNPWEKAFLWVEQDGRTRPIENGTAVALGEVTVEVFVAPFPPLREGSIDLYVTETATRKPVDDSALRIIFDMYMPHGSIRAEALPTGGGHFLVPYRLVMPGEWRADVTVTHGRSDATIGLIFRVD